VHHAVVGGTLCSVVSGAAGLGASITDLSLLARSGWRQPAVAWEMPWRGFDWLGRVGWSYDTSSNSRPRHLDVVECFRENRVEECLQETEDDWKQLESVSTPAAEGLISISALLTCWLHDVSVYWPDIFRQQKHHSLVKIGCFRILHWLPYHALFVHQYQIIIGFENHLYM